MTTEAPTPTKATRPAQNWLVRIPAKRSEVQRFETLGDDVYIVLSNGQKFTLKNAHKYTRLSENVVLQFEDSEVLLEPRFLQSPVHVTTIDPAFEASLAQTPPANVATLTDLAPAPSIGLGATTARWLGLAGLLGALGASGSGGQTSSSPAAAATTLSLITVAGPFIAAIEYEIFNAQGERIASGTSDTNGQLSLNLPSAYSGLLMVKASDRNGAEKADYVDEKTAQATALDTPLRAFVYVQAGQATSATVSPISEIAVQVALRRAELDPLQTGGSLSTDLVASTNSEIATRFGLSSVTSPVTPIITANGAANSAYDEKDNLNNDAESYGRALAKLSGNDALSGSVSSTIQAYVNAWLLADSTQSMREVADLIYQGAKAFKLTGDTPTTAALVNLDLPTQNNRTLNPPLDLNRMAAEKASLKDPVLQNGSINIQEAQLDIVLPVALPGQALAGDVLLLRINAANIGGNSSPQQTISHTLTAQEAGQGFANVAVSNATLMASGVENKRITAQVTGADGSDSGVYNAWSRGTEADKPLFVIDINEPDITASSLAINASGYRYIMLRRGDFDWFDIAEVQVLVAGVNVALNKTVVLGPQGTYSIGSAMVDGNTGTDYVSKDRGTNQWVQIDLGQVHYHLDNITITPRAGYEQRINNTHVFGGPTDMSDSASNTTASQAPSGGTLLFTTSASTINAPQSSAPIITPAAYLNKQTMAEGKTADFTVSFSEAVGGLTASNFKVYNHGGAELSGLSIAASPNGTVAGGRSSTWTVAVGSLNNATSATSLKLVLTSRLGITDAAGNPLQSSTFNTGEAYAADALPPVVTLRRNGTHTLTRDNVNPSRNNETFTYTFTKYPVGFSLSDVAVTAGGTLTPGTHFTWGTPSAITPVGNAWEISATFTPLPALALEGNINFTVNAGGLTDDAGNTNAESNTLAVSADTTKPAVTGNPLISAVDALGSPITRPLLAGDQILVTLNTDEAVTVAGRPAYTIDVGGQSRQALYDANRSSASKLVFAYTVAAGDDDTSGGITSSTNAIQANIPFRYVMLRRGEFDWFDIAEVQINVGGVNVALNKTVTLGPQGTYSSENAVVDGSSGNAYISRDRGNNQWIQIDLGQVYQTLDNLIITPVASQPGRLRNTYVYMSESNMASDADTTTFNQAPSGSRLLFTTAAYTVTTEQSSGSLPSIRDNNDNLIALFSLPAAGNNLGVDTQAPVFTSAQTAPVPENTAVNTVVYDANATDNRGSAGIAYFLQGTDAALLNINRSTGEIRFTASPNFEAPADSDANNNYQFDVLAVDAAGNKTTQNVSLKVTNVSDGFKFGDAVIDLGTYGRLIKPVNVDGKWYYAWDLNGDGLLNRDLNTNGKYASDGSVANAQGSGWQLDQMTHDVLDDIFKFAADFTTQRLQANTDNTFRFANIGGVKVALPTVGDGKSSSTAFLAATGTAIDNSPAGEINPSYDDLLAIWDAHNGTENNTGQNGTPDGWQSAFYWTATPAGTSHALVDLSRGEVYVNYSNLFSDYAVLQVL